MAATCTGIAITVPDPGVTVSGIAVPVPAVAASVTDRGTAETR
jgi:hypothetical protein